MFAAATAARLPLLSLSSPLQLAGRARCRPFGAILEPLCDLRERGHVDLRRARPGENAGNIEVGNGETIPEQVAGATEDAFEHPKRLGEGLFRRVRGNG